MAKQSSLLLATLQKKFSTEEKCREHLFKLRFPDGFVCPKCGHKKYFLISTRNLYECKSCGYQASITALKKHLNISYQAAIFKWHISQWLS